MDKKRRFSNIEEKKKLSEQLKIDGKMKNLEKDIQKIIVKKFI